MVKKKRSSEEKTWDDKKTKKTAIIDNRCSKETDGFDLMI
jgi:hypothetical protein